MRRVLLGLILVGVVSAIVVAAHSVAPRGRHRPARAGGGYAGPAARFPRRTFYVSAHGDDRAGGTTPATAWRTLAAVDRARLQPGDAVLFQGGATFDGHSLSPGWGTTTSGTAGAPITFSSYGRGRARIVQGIWFRGEDHLAFRRLTLGTTAGISGRGLEGTGNHVTVEDLVIAHAALGLESVGDDWTIVGNTIRDTGDSGMLLGFSAGRPGYPPGGHSYLISHNTIVNTGLDRSLTFGTHGIYLKVADATVSDNTIDDFHDDGISVRYRNNTITGNRISDGPIGLAWFQYDDRRGTSIWRDNTLKAISVVGIFICRALQGCRAPLERFTIRGNTLEQPGGPAAHVALMDP